MLIFTVPTINETEAPDAAPSLTSPIFAALRITGSSSEAKSPST